MTKYHSEEEKAAGKREATRRYRERYPERAKAAAAQWWAQHEEEQRQWSKEHPYYHVEKRYGMYEGQYAELLELQGGVCAICHEPSDRALAVDHCHTTGKVRGLLCSNCNAALGMLQDDIQILYWAIAYIRSYESHD